MTASNRIEIMLPKLGALPVYLPLFGHNVPAGFPSPADDHMEALISLDEELIHHKTSTFFVRARGNSMTGAGIHDGDLLVVDKSLEPISGDIVIASVDGNITVIQMSNNAEIANTERRRFIKKTAIAALIFSAAGSLSGVAEAAKESAKNEGIHPFVLSF